MKVVLFVPEEFLFFFFCLFFWSSFPAGFYQSGVLLHLFTLFRRKLISLALKDAAPSRCKWGIKDKRLGGNNLRGGIPRPREQLIIRQVEGRKELVIALEISCQT